jgi:hypothetical protein
MLDLSHIPNSQQDVRIFYAISGSNSWQTWQKPRKCNYVWIMCIGGGAGGAGGGTTNNQGSAGGQGGAITRALFNSSFLSDTLYIQVGVGGAGGLNTSTSGNGTRSIVALQPAVVTQNIVVISGTAAASFTTPETAATQATMTFATLGNFISTAGLFLGNLDITPLTSTITTQGTSGGLKDSTTNSVTPPKNMLATSISPFISGGISSTITDGTRGNDGYTSWKPFFSTGGTGGGSSTVGVGGAGGNGGIGSGGGGGGTGQTVGGVGGRGGDGLVVIISF